MPKLPVEIPEELLRHWHQEFRHNSPQSPNVALTVPLLHVGDLQQSIQQALEGSQEIPYSTTSQAPCLPGNTDRPAAGNDPEQGTEDRHKKRQKVQPAGPTEWHEYEDRTITVQAGTTTQLNIRLHIQNDNDSGKQYNYYNTDNYYRQSEWQGSGSGSGSWDG